MPTLLVVSILLPLQKYYQDTMAIYMIPCPIVGEKLDTIPPETISVLLGLTVFIVERAKTARHYIKISQHPVPINKLNIFEINKHDPELGIYSFLEKNKNKDIGIISESGCPGIADPGSRVVKWAHQNGIKVIPLVGPTSIIMALMASGFNGQSFCFNGYLPRKKPALSRELKRLEGMVNKFNQSQLFIEAPYRNQFMLQTCMEVLRDDSWLCFAVDIGDQSESIIAQPIAKWKKTDTSSFHKRPAVFVMGKHSFITNA